MGTAERRQRERSEMHDAIADAAVELFVSEGFENTSMRRIAEKIEYTPGSIYSYFKDKDEILFEIHKRGFNKLFEELQQAPPGSDPLDRLYQVGRQYIKFAIENQNYYDLMFIEKSTAKTIRELEQWECGHQAYDVLRQIISEAIRQGFLPDGDVDLASYSFWSLVHGIVSLVLRGRCMVPEEQHNSLMYGSFDYTWSAIMRRK